ncbi:GNAT family N-acetyltransferase [Vaginella massiliensis]|uniref:GNAT family N-acetyltransferase n=1 Tax=Vaginella massiliensis TaxID=1816680 RepID=UPI0037520107
METNYLKFRKATIADLSACWAIIENAIAKRKAEGSEQWQDGYPNLTVLQSDIENEYGYVAENPQGKCIAYIALIADGDEAYENIDGQWLTNTPYLVVHRLAVHQDHKIKGLAEWMMKNAEQVALQQNRKSIKIDTNFDNAPMLHIISKLGYQYCGEVKMRDGARKAFEKVISEAS